MTAQAGTAVARIVRALREEILAGRLAPDAPLREEALATRFAVSRHTVRTALAHLERTGLARSAPYAGVRVSAYDPDAAAALQDLRRALESEAVAMLHDRHGGRPWPEAVRGPVEAAVDRLGAAEAEADQVAVLHAHTAVHLALVAAAGSPRITAAYEQLADELDLLLLHARPEYAPGELERQHRALLVAVQRAGAAPIRAHLADTVARLAEASARPTSR